MGAILQAVFSTIYFQIHFLDRKLLLAQLHYIISSFCKLLVEWTWDMGQGQKPLYMTRPLMLVAYLRQMGNGSIVGTTERTGGITDTRTTNGGTDGQTDGRAGSTIPTNLAGSKMSKDSKTTPRLCTKGQMEAFRTFGLHFVSTCLTPYPLKCVQMYQDVQRATIKCVNGCKNMTPILERNNGLSSVRHQAIIWTNAGLLSIEPLTTNFRDISNKIKLFHWRKCISKYRL